METFEFVAYNLLGKRKQGTVKAWSLSEAKTRIQKRGFYLASINTVESFANQSRSYFSLIRKLSEFFLSRGDVKE
jgi:type II secretory pathway component PulF